MIDRVRETNILGIPLIPRLVLVISLVYLALHTKVTYL